MADSGLRMNGTGVTKSHNSSKRTLQALGRQAWIQPKNPASAARPSPIATKITQGQQRTKKAATAAPIAAESVLPTTALSLLENTVKAVLAPVSLSALAAFALPGVGGLLIICAAGMRFGYRQAKAALAVRTTGISRFARQGPLGVVRSGSLVAVHPRHPRTLRVIRPERPRAAPLLEEAA